MLLGSAAFCRTPLRQQRNLRQFHFPSWPLMFAGPSATPGKALVQELPPHKVYCGPHQLYPSGWPLKSCCCASCCSLYNFVAEAHPTHRLLWVMITCLTLTPRAGPQSHAAGPAAAPCRTPSQQQQRPYHPPAAPPSQHQGPPGSLQERSHSGPLIHSHITYALSM